MFERESRREKILEARNREIRLKLKQTKQAAENEEEVAEEEVENAGEAMFHDNLVQQAETDFYQTIEKELLLAKPPEPDLFGDISRIEDDMEELVPPEPEPEQEPEPVPVPETKEAPPAKDAKGKKK